MERIINQYHSKNTLFLSLSKVFERASYYGIRSLIILYMVGESLKMPQVEALELYGIFTSSIIFSKFLGGFLGDLVLGNRKTIVLACVLQALGTFILCQPSQTALYIAIFFIVLGSGLFHSNMISCFGKSYLNKTKLLDSGFAIFYLAISLGALIGTLLIGYLGKLNYSFGFFAAGILILISGGLVLLSKQETSIINFNNKAQINIRAYLIVSVCIITGVFWAVYEYSNYGLFEIQNNFKSVENLNIPTFLFDLENSFFAIPLAIITAIYWAYIYSNQIIKLFVSFIAIISSFLLLLLIPEIPTGQHFIIYIISMFLLGFAEAYIAPVLFSILTKYTSPKYLTIAVSLAFIPMHFFIYFIGLYYEFLSANPIITIQLAILVLGISFFGCIVYYRMIKKIHPTLLAHLDL